MQLVYFVLPIFPRSIHFNLLLFYTHGTENAFHFCFMRTENRKEEIISFTAIIKSYYYHYFIY